MTIQDEFKGLTYQQTTADGFTANLAKKYNMTDRNVRYIRAKYFAAQENKGIVDACDSVGVDISTAPDMWIKTKEASVRVKNPFFVSEAENKVHGLWEQMILDIKNQKKVFKNIEYPDYEEKGQLALISPADVHIGKLASKFETMDEYNSSIARERVEEGVYRLSNKAKRLDVEKILLIIGNDILHIDTPKRTTTSGTPQDTCGMWYDNFLIAKRLYVDVIDRLLDVAPVHIQFNPSNHDFMSGFYLSQVVEAYYHGNKNVTFACDMTHRKYYIWGQNLIGTTHGDGAKIDDLALLMAHEAKGWSDTKHRYFFAHHFHHKIAKDKMSVQIEALRTPSGTDGWHHRNGYQHAPKAMEMFIFDKLHGQTNRMIHYF